MDEMKGKIALITGASSGIGRAAALKFAAEGARVALVARRGDRLAQVARDIEARGGESKVIVADVTQEREIERVVNETVAAFGGSDVVVNAAGIIANGTIENTKLPDWDYMFNVNVRGPFYLIQRALPHLIASQGNVVNVSSVTGIRAFPGVLAYCSSKAALDQLTHCAALELASKGVRVNAVSSGPIETLSASAIAGLGDMLAAAAAKAPLRRNVGAEEVGDAVAFLCSDLAKGITGQVLYVDGGFHILPGL